MANGDLISRIILQSQGGDDAARDVLKVKKAYDETAKAAEAVPGLSSPAMLGTGGKGAVGAASAPRVDEASTRKQAQILGQEIGKATVGAQKTAEKADEPFKRIRDQQEKEKAKPGTEPPPPPAGKPGVPASAWGRGGYAMSAVNAFGGVGGQLSGFSDVPGAVGSAASGIGGFLTNFATAGSTLMKLGVAGAIAGTAIKIVGNIAGQEEERIKSLVGSGLTSRLGTKYDTLRTFTLQGLGTGVSQETLTGLLSAYASGGGTYRDKDTGMRLRYAAEAATSTGMDAGTLGSWLAASSRMKLGSGLDREIMRYGTQGFGAQNLSDFVAEITRATSALESLGVSAVSAGTAESMMRQMAAYGTTGLSIPAATSVNQLAMSRAAAASKLSKPEDMIVIRSLLASNPKMSISDAMAYMEAHPEYVSETVYGNIAASTPSSGIRDLLASSYLGGSMTQAKDWRSATGLKKEFDAAYAKYSKAYGEAAAAGKPLPKWETFATRADKTVIPYLKSEETAYMSREDVGGREAMALMQQSLFAGVESFFAGLKRSVTGAFSGKPKMDFSKMVDESGIGTGILGAATFGAGGGVASSAADKAEATAKKRAFLSALSPYASSLSRFGVTPESMLSYESSSASLATLYSAALSKKGKSGRTLVDTPEEKAAVETAVTSIITSAGLGKYLAPGATAMDMMTLPFGSLSSDAATSFAKAADKIANALQSLIDSGVITDSGAATKGASK